MDSIFISKLVIEWHNLSFHSIDLVEIALNQMYTDPASPIHFHNYQELTNQMAVFRPSTGIARAFKLMLVIIEYTGVRVHSSKCQSSKWFGYWSKCIKF